MPAKNALATTNTDGLDGFRVALNPRNPEANSWYNPETGINLFLAPKRDKNDRPIDGTGPISFDISEFTGDELKPVLNAIRHGILIIASGTLPEGLEKDQIDYYAAPRSRWDPDLVDTQKAALKHFDSLTQ